MMNAASFGCHSGAARDLARRENPVYVCGGTENKFYRYETFCIFASSNIYKTYNNEK